MNKIKLLGLAILAFALQAEAQVWTIKSEAEWASVKQSVQHIQLKDGLASSTQTSSFFTSNVKQFQKKQKVKSITFKQSADWNNWSEIPNVGDPRMDDAPVFISPKEGEYYLLARLWPTEFGKKQWDENGDIANDPRSKTEMGYHAWFSTNMKDWKHCGPVSAYRERWVTTAEYKDGQFYIYYDNPNDEDPHLIIDNDLKDGRMGKDYGMIFKDPSHGSDCGILRDDDDTWHLIYENWDPINAKEHAWDSPLGGHAVSPDGIHDFKILAPAVDRRTTPTGKYETFYHRASFQDMKYEVHTPEQDAFGDWTAIKVGGQYYLFCDYDPAGGHIKIGCFTSDSLNKEYRFCGALGGGHPDPSIGFAEGQFYLLQQHGNVDFVSPGPWVPGVEARVGVDTNGNGEIDQWTTWQEVTETYALKPGFARIVNAAPATLDIRSLPEGYGFCFEYRTHTIAEQKALVSMQSVHLAFE